MSRLRRRNRMCSSRVSGTAYRQGNGSTLCSPTEEKILCRTPIFAAVAGLRFASGSLRERGRFTRRRKPQVVSFLCPRRAGELGSLRKRPHDTAAQSRFYKLSIEYIHVKRNRQNRTKCPLNKNEPTRRFAALILGCVKGRGFHRK